MKDVSNRIKIVKKDGSLQGFDKSKIVIAIHKSADRVMVKLTEDDDQKVVDEVLREIAKTGLTEIPVATIHKMVEIALESVNAKVAKSYREYRNYKTVYAAIYEKVFSEAERIRYLGDKENSNSDATLVATKRSLIFNELNKEHYKHFFLNKDELQAIYDGYIYIHDMSARLDTLNCCLFDLKTVLSGGFEMGNLWYNEPKGIDSALAVTGDVILSVAAQQYGGFTIPQIDETLSKYVAHSFDKYLSQGLEYYDEEKTEEQRDYAYQRACENVKRDLRQGLQGIEYKLNTLGSSRGDYPFVTFTFGLATDKWGKMIAEEILRTRMNGQGKPGFKRPVLFPKLVFLYDEELHEEGCQNADLFDLAIECSSKAMYPDFLSLTGEGAVNSVTDMYKRYKKVVSPMGCRAFLSPYYEGGGMEPSNEDDQPVFIGRWNGGAISLHLPMILAKSREDGRDFYKVLDEYLEMIRRLHIRTRDYLGKLKASSNPVAFTQGGFYKGNLKPSDNIRPLLDYVTFSFGITALNELQQLYNQCSLIEDNSFALEVMEYINKKITGFKKEDGILYAIYGTPAESLCGKQIQQFRKRYGAIKNVSDREYVSNSFHCHVTENIDPIEKQDAEREFWDLFGGGRIQYVRYPLDYNLKAIKSLVRRAMKLGFYEGINMALSYCESCGHEELNMDKCPICGSRFVTKIDRMNGYLSYSRVAGDTRLNAAKMAEITERKSM
ncbi:MAG: anaerobic ribonucleoside-triphosphate reductase [Candidatus Saccharibacteria bacterium]|nr:anaerobic ribonucleoside-triphosphate reductase [Candidatus Saccharibacteria bacterium]